MKRFLTSIFVLVVAMFFSCDLLDSAKDEDDNGNGNGSSITYEYVQTENGTVTNATAPSLVLSYVETYAWCEDTTEDGVDNEVFLSGTSTNSVNLTYVISGETLVLTEIDTSWDGPDGGPDTISSIAQEVATYTREGTGTGIEGTWVSTTIPAVTYLKGAADPDDMDEVSIVENLKSTLVVTSTTYSMTDSIDLKSNWQEIMMGQFKSMVEGMLKENGLDTLLDITVTTSANGFSINAPLAPTPLAATITSGTTPDNTMMTLTYNGTTGTMPMGDQRPTSQADCNTGNSGEEMFGAFISDLMAAKGLGSPKKLAKLKPVL